MRVDTRRGAREGDGSFLLVRARLEGRHTCARALSLCRALFAPRRSVAPRTGAVLDDVQRGRGSLATLALPAPRPAGHAEDRLLVRTALEGRVLLRDWDAITA